MTAFVLLAVWFALGLLVALAFGRACHDAAERADLHARLRAGEWG